MKLIIDKNEAFILNDKEEKIASTTNDNLPFIDFNGFEDICGWFDVWTKGNRIKITTLYDYEERGDFPNHNVWVNRGKQNYEGVVVEIDKGLALKTDDGKIFKTQGTYWFGSILSQEIELIQKAQELLSDRRFTLEDIAIAFEAGRTFEYSGRESLTQIEYIQSLSQSKLWKVELEMEDSFRTNKETYIDDSGVKGNYSTHSKKPKLTNGKIKITKIL